MNILFRADASLNIGTGHLMRCLALAQTMLNQKYNPILLTNISSSFLDQRLVNEDIKVIYLPENIDNFTDIQETIKTAKNNNSPWVIVDGYQFNSEYQKCLKEAGLKVLFFDDYGHCNYYYADLILNQNLGADESLYKNRESYTQLLLGNHYTLLRKEFLSWQQWQRIIKPLATKILITLGGSDPDNVTLKVIKSLKLIFDPPQPPLKRGEFDRKELEIIVILGGSNPHFNLLKSYCDTLNLNIKLKQNIINMPELMAWADLAIAAGGSTNWELLFMGLPSIIITIADNQIDIAKKLNKMGLIINLGWHEDGTIEIIKNAILRLINSPIKRQEMSQKGRKLIDGYGSMRILEKMD